MGNLWEHINTKKELLIEERSDQLANAIKEGQDIDEGLLGSIVGGITGLTAGATVMKAVCKALGVKEGPLYNMLTSKIICGVAGAAIGYKL